MPPLGQLAFALSAGLTILGGMGELARAEDPLSGKILSACRVPPRAAFGEIRKPSPETKNGYTFMFMLAATRFKFTGDYDRAIEQIDQAIKADPANPRFYSARGVARILTSGHLLSRQNVIMTAPSRTLDKR